MASTVTNDSYSTPFATDLVVGQALGFSEQGSSASVNVDGWAGSFVTGTPEAFNEQGTSASVTTEGKSGTLTYGFVVGGAVPDKAEVTVTGVAGTLYIGTSISTIPDLTISEGQSIDLIDLYVSANSGTITGSQVLNLNTTYATYTHVSATSGLLTGVLETPADMTGLQLEVTYT